MLLTPPREATPPSARPLGPSRPAFRKDIEGLRGIAVLLVVLYHVGVPGFAGGYVGVDVFFVLSGYLITGILATEILATGTLDLPRFYARRARRLLPAMAVLLVAVTVFAYPFYAPMEQRTIAQTAVATAAYFSNFHFANSATDYLGAGAETNPLLHTWSLAVEEQFYLVWPLLVLLALGGLRRLRRTEVPPDATPPDERRLLWVMVAVCIVSFALTLWLMGTHRTHWAFFSSPTRAWEFAVGGLGALLPRFDGRALLRPGMRFGALEAVPHFPRALGWLGLGAVLLAGTAYSARTPFPGVAALLPVLGTVLALRAGTARTDTAMARVLAWRPLQEVGRLSYSWYLWHWPVLVFAAALYGPLSLGVRLALAAGSLVLAEASYRLVENPVRHHRLLAERSGRGLALAATLTVFGVALALGWDGVAERATTTPEQAPFTRAAADISDLYDTHCHADHRETNPAGCTFGPDEAERTIALFGDSHATQWEPALSALLEEHHWKLVSFTKSSCPTPDLDYFDPWLGRMYDECRSWRTAVMDRLVALRPDVVIIASSYDYGLPAEEWREGFGRTVETLRSVAGAVLVFNDTPFPDFAVPACLSRRVWQRDHAPFQTASTCTFDPRDAYRDAISDAERATAARYEDVRFVDFNPSICPDARCEALQDGLIIYRDAHHLTKRYARTLAPRVADAIEQAIRREPNAPTEPG